MVLTKEFYKMSNHHPEDFSMAFVDSCDKLTLLLIHGFPLNSSMWSPQIDELADYVRIIAPDLRGHGNSDSVKRPYAMSLLADDCADLLGHLGVSTPFVVCGLSMGGYVALEFYRRYPEHVAGLVLTATRAGADSAEGKANRDKAAADIDENGLDGLIDGMLPKLVAPKTAVSDPDIIDFIREIMESTSDEGAIGALMGMKTRSDSTDLLAEIDVPTLIIHGKDDQIIPVSEAEAMHKAIKNSKLVVLENAGHMLNLEQVDAFNDALIDFLEEIDATIDED
jgi:3-oxoadipate enol-lactonase